MGMLAVWASFTVVPVRGGVPKQCSAMKECAGLQGDCCPNAAGTQLDCCVLAGVRIAAEEAQEKADKAKKEADAAQAKADQAKAKAEKEEARAKKEGAQAKYIQDHIKEAKCKNNAGCKNLDGFCCPNLDGTVLGCCGKATDLSEEVALEETSNGNAPPKPPFQGLVNAALSWGAVIAVIVAAYCIWKKKCSGAREQ